MNEKPLYQKLYADMIRDKYPDKENLLKQFLKKESWTTLDVIEVNDLLFGLDKNKNSVRREMKHRAYDEESVKQILEYQKKNKLNNTQLANKYNLSRNTVKKWKDIFMNEE